MREKLCEEIIRLPSLVPELVGLDEPIHTEIRYCGLDAGHDDKHLTIYNGQPLRWQSNTQH